MTDPQQAADVARAEHEDVARQITDDPELQREITAALAAAEERGRLRERERCARIADKRAEICFQTAGDPTERCAGIEANFIADCIRAPQPVAPQGGTDGEGG